MLSRYQLTAKFHSQACIRRSTTTGTNIGTLARHRQGLEIQPPPRLLGRKRSLGQSRRAIAKSALRRTRRDIDEVGEIELLPRRAETGEEVGTAGGDHHRGWERGMIGRRGGGGESADLGAGVGRGGRGGEVEEQIGAFLALGIHLAVSERAAAGRRRGTRGRAVEVRGAEVEGVVGQVVVGVVVVVGVRGEIGGVGNGGVVGGEGDVGTRGGAEVGMQAALERGGVQMGFPGMPSGTEGRGAHGGIAFGLARG